MATWSRRTHFQWVGEEWDYQLEPGDMSEVERIMKLSGAPRLAVLSYLGKEFDHVQQLLARGVIHIRQ